MPRLDTNPHAAQAAAAGSAEKRAYVQQIFSEIAPRYDLLNHVLSFNIDRGWRRKAIAALDWQRRPSGAFVDLCAGTLDVGTELAARRGFQGSVIGADFAEPMLREGRHKIGELPVRPVVADALELPLRDARTAGIIIAFGVRNLADLDAGLREMHRVLAPNARAVILEFSTPRWAPVRWFYHAYFHGVLPVIGRLVSGHPTAYRYLPNSVSNFPAPEQLAKRMAAAGFVNVWWRPLSFGIAAMHCGERGAA